MSILLNTKNEKEALKLFYTNCDVVLLLSQCICDSC